MAIRQVVAYAMREEEHEVAGRVLEEIEDHGDAFIVGWADDDGIAELQAAGLIVEEVDVAAESEVVARRGASTAAAGHGDSVPRPPLLTGDEEGAFLLRVATPLSEGQHGLVEALGATFLDRIGTYSWTVRATVDAANALTGLDFVDEITRPGGGGWAGEEALVDEVPRGEPLLFDLVLDGSRPLDEVVADLTSRDVEILTVSSTRIRIRVPATDPIVADPISVPGVVFGFEGNDVELHTDRLRTLLGVDAVVAAVPGLDGAGETVAVLDTGLDATHLDFAGRVVASCGAVLPGDTEDRAGHGTHVAGIVAGDGAESGGTYRGVAPGASLVVQASADGDGTMAGLPTSIGERLAEAYDAKARIMNNSWGVRNAHAEYTADCWEIDEFVWNHRDFVVVFSAGNDCTDRGRQYVSGTGYSVTPPGTAKNVITVGAARGDRSSGGWSTDTWGSRFSNAVTQGPIVGERISGDSERLAAFSGRGPCSDRRIKPDVVAPGTDICSTRASAAAAGSFWGLAPGGPRYAYLGGTSMAAPAVAGCCALIRQWYGRLGVEPSAALVKATLVNGTRWLTGSDADPYLSSAPNNEQGFGCVDMRTTLPAGGSTRLVFADTWRTPGRQFQRNNTAMTWRVDVAAGAELRICLAYTDAPGRGVQNDLNLYVEQPSGAKLLANEHAPERIHHQLDKDNAVEIVRVLEPEPGTWRLRVVCGSLTRRDLRQDYALVVTGAIAGDLVFHGW